MYEDDNNKEVPYTIDQVDIYASAYTQEWIMYLCSLELPPSMQLPKPPWYMKYKKRKKYPFKKAYTVSVKNNIHKPIDAPPSKKIQELKRRGITGKKWVVPVEEDYQMIVKKINRGRHTFVSVLLSIDDRYYNFGNITNQITGKQYSEIIVIEKKPGILKYGFVAGDLIEFEARLTQINTGYTSYGENIDDSVVEYKFTKLTKYQKIN